MPETKNNNKNPCLLEGHLNRNFKTDFQFEALCVRVCVCVCVCVCFFLTLCDPMDYNLPGFCVYGIFQAQILEWVAISYSRGCSPPRDGVHISCI